MNRRQYAEAKAGLSKRAAKMLVRIEAGQFYPWPESLRSPTIQELEKAGLIQFRGRVEVWRSAAVPSYGYTPAKAERFKP